MPINIRLRGCANTGFAVESIRLIMLIGYLTLIFSGTEINKFVGGKMFFVKFGKSRHDPIWPVDIFEPQVHESSAILGYLLADAENGFPVPFYPLCLQKAHEHAALVDFDFDILQDEIFEGIRSLLGDESSILDRARFQDTDPAQKRY